MNGEMYQISLLTAAVKKAFYEKSDLSYTPLKYEKPHRISAASSKEAFHNNQSQSQRRYRMV